MCPSSQMFQSFFLFYRCKNETHPATGNKFKVYPTYDFACPIVDSIEGVTHSLRTTEYMDRDEQFNWFIDALGLRKPNIYAYARLNLTNTVMSKRKLTWLVDEGLVQGWDDPRLPTVRGVLRRGLTVDALKMFIVAQGSSRSVVFMEWDKIWAMNKKVIDPIAPRFTTVTSDYFVEVRIKDVQVESVKADKHPKDPNIGQKTVWRGPTIVIDGVDAEALKEGENTTFINWGNMIINKVHKKNDKVDFVEATPNLDNKDFKKTLKVTWLAKVPDESQADFTPTVCVHFDHIISKPVLDKNDEFKNFVNKNTETKIDMLGDPELKNLQKGEIIQIQRRGFFIVDKPYSAPNPNLCKTNPIVLISIPDGTPDSYGAPGKKAVSAQTKAGPAKAGKDSAPKSSAPAKAAKSAPQAGGDNADALNDQITEQGNKVRDLKTKKADKGEVDAAVKTLLELKAKYKDAAGKDWKPGAHQAQPKAAPAGGDNADALNDQITEQGNKVRDLKTKKADKGEVDAAVKTLLELKAKYKDAAGKDWKPGAHQSQAKAAAPKETKKEETSGGWSAKAVAINDDIAAQGDKVRQLKTDKADKEAVKTAVDVLLSLKAKFKSETGLDWKPGMKPPAPVEASSCGDDGDKLNEDITEQGNKVRDLKSKKAEKPEIDAAVKTLLELKTKYKSATGKDWKPGTHQPKTKASTPPKDAGQGKDCYLFRFQLIVYNTCCSFNFSSRLNYQLIVYDSVQ